MTHVLHVIENLTTGGAARALMTCAAGCAASDGSHHLVVSLGPASNASLELAKEYKLDVLNAPDLGTLQEKVANSDILHTHYWNAPRMGEFLRMELPPIRLLLTCHVGGLHPPQVITRDIVDFADMVQTIGPFSNDLPLFAELDPEVSINKVRMSYCAADFSRLSGFTPRIHDGYNVTYLGTVDFVKMHPDYIALSNALKVPEAHFLVCGGGGAYSELKRQAFETGSFERFSFLKEKKDIASVLSVTDVFGYPLCEDNYSAGELVLQEVAYAGIPAVVFNYGGAGRLVVNDFTGYVVRSAPEYRDALEYLYRYPKERDRIGQNARQYAIQLFGEKHTVRATRKIYAQLMTQPKKSRVYGAPAGETFFSRPVRLADLVMEEVGASGAFRFIESLGETAPWFLESLSAPDPEDQMSADELIARSTPVMADGALSFYQDYYPDDGFLRFWNGLVLEERGDYVSSAVEFTKALQSGCDHWRVYWHLARCANSVGETQMARDALQRVLSLYPDFGAAREMLVGLLEGAEADISPQTLRLRRDIFMTAGELNKAEEAGRTLLDLTTKLTVFDDVESYYNIGLELHKAGRIESAKSVYLRVAEDDLAGNTLCAWALFKHGELLLDLGQNETARSFFCRALEYNPNHTKALIYLTLPEQPLRVSINGKKRDGYIPVPMSALDENLWTYYFFRRSPDDIEIVFDTPLNKSDMSKLGNLLTKHMAPGGQTQIFLSGAYSSEKLHQTFIKHLKTTGLWAESNSESVWVQANVNPVSTEPKSY